MKKAVKIICIIFASILIACLGLFIYYIIITKDAKLDQSKLINMQKIINVYDTNGNLLFKDGEDKQATSIEDIPLHVQKAFIAIEDKRFYSHNGVDVKGLTRAMLANVKSFSFKEGGSTISQQLIKNTHLSSKKTVKRKLNELKLSKELEKSYSKDQILEKYLNSIYFGDNCYGITSASNHYFGKEPKDLTINEGATLAGIIKAPTNYSPYNDLDKCFERKNLVLKQMYEQGYIQEQSYNENLSKQIITLEKEAGTIYDINYFIKKELNEIVKDYPFSTGNLSIYTNIDLTAQKNIQTKIENSVEPCDKSAIILNKNGAIKAYYSTCGEIPRQVGSTLKPLLVYAPAIDSDVVYSCTPLLDEKTNFNGYSPSNYNDKYYGYVSVKESLAKSLNVCSVKLLNYTGIDKAKSYLENMNFPLSEQDNSLCLALGATQNGAKLSQLSALYTVFLNNGSYYEPYCIDRIESENIGVIFKKNIKGNQIFSEETTHIMNDILEATAINGTAKKLSFTNIPLCSKTGTVGNENGNFDAYNISYNTENIISVWFGNKDNSLMDNSITGGASPTILAGEVWKAIYKDKKPPQSFTKSSLVCEKNIDKIEYETGHNVLLANSIIPKRYMTTALFKNSKLPQVSDRFSSPKVNNVDIKLTENGVSFILDIPEYYNAYIYREVANEKILIYNTLNNKNNFLDEDITENTEYLYSIVPYFKGDNVIHTGNEIFLNKIRTPVCEINDWWIDDLS